MTPTATTTINRDHAKPELVREQFYLLGKFVVSVFARAAIDSILEQSPLRRMRVPGGHTMSAAMSNCGALGWTADESGYRYCKTDPLTDTPWPIMPECLHELAAQAAAVAGFDNFDPDCCLINQYVSGAKMGLHRDADEQDFNQPIVSVSLGASARFVLGGLTRRDKTRGVMLHDGDVLVWGSSARLVYHGVGVPRGTSPVRYNLTFRKAG